MKPARPSVVRRTPPVKKRLRLLSRLLSRLQLRRPDFSQLWRRLRFRRGGSALLAFELV